MADLQERVMRAMCRRSAECNCSIPPAPVFEPCFKLWNQAGAAIAECRRWTPVEDALPDIDQIVQVRFPRGYDGADVYAYGARIRGDIGCWLWGIQTSRGGIVIGETPSWSDIKADDDYPVTHWAPLLPPPPEGEAG